MSHDLETRAGLDPLARTERRIRADHPNHELRNARVRVARKVYECAWCSAEAGVFIPVYRHMDYARISETRLPVCGVHFTEADIVTVTKRRGGV